MMPYDELPHHFCLIMADLGHSVGLHEYDLEPPEKPCLVYHRITNTTNLRLQMTSPSGKLEEWFTHSHDIYPYMVDKVRQELLKLGYDLEVIK